MSRADRPITLASAGRLALLSVLASLMLTGGPQSLLMAFMTVLALAATATVAPSPSVLFALPAWVFRALTVPAVLRDRVPTIARAWWLPTDR